MSEGQVIFSFIILFTQKLRQLGVCCNLWADFGITIGHEKKELNMDLVIKIQFTLKKGFLPITKPSGYVLHHKTYLVNLELNHLF